MDLIFVNDFVFFGRHGARPKEKEQAQRFSIDIEASLTDTLTAAQSDNLDDALDYSPFRTIVRSIIENESHNLIERIAHRIADQILLQCPRVESILVRLKKIDIWGNGIPGIVITKSR